MSEYTKGPWRVSGHKSLFIEPLNIISHHNEYGSGGSHIIGASQVYNKRTIKEAQANARLIAAAPDLLEAVSAMREAYGRLHDFLSEAIEGGRLRECDVPDDYQAFIEQLAGPCLEADYKVETAIKKATGEGR